MSNINDTIFNKDAILKLSTQYPRSRNSNNSSIINYSYGTAGFRGLAPILPSVCLRMGMLAALRSLYNNSLIVGIMVTASHNDEPDNGLKLIDSNGEMLVTEWEYYANLLANADESELYTVLVSIANKIGLNINNTNTSNIVNLFIGRDTRPSSPELSNLVELGARSLLFTNNSNNIRIIDYGLLTTPILHYLVLKSNTNHNTASIQQYINQLATAFNTIMKLQLSNTNNNTNSNTNTNSNNKLLLDCSNGVGTLIMNQIIPLINNNYLSIELINTNTDSINNPGLLNHKVGADYVQKSRCLPIGISNESALNQRCASFDGDADRIVYYTVNQSQSQSNYEFQLFDGDRIIALYSIYISKLLTAAGLTNNNNNNNNNITIGIVQTAYANGASTIYMTESLQLTVEFANTGVKYLHHLASKYSIGIYFEANGHGTIIFQPATIIAFKSIINNSNSTIEQMKSAEILLNLTELINPTVGDALSDTLLIETALNYLNWSIIDWNNIYTELPSTMRKVIVNDRNTIKTTNAERTCTEPAGLQAEIDRLVNNGNSNNRRRAFVRPSGTEDIVRVYAEASNRAEVELLADQVCEAVARLAGGI